MNKEKRDIRIVFLIFSAIFGVLAWRHYPSILSYAFMGVVLVILPLVAFAPTLLRPVFKLWLKIAHAIGWFQGRMEFGPRALGARSIIGDARNAEMQKKMNLKIKYRESFRPFAPSVLLEHVSE